MNFKFSMTHSLRIAFVCLAWTAFQSYAAHASLIGDQIFIDRLIPSRETPFSFCQSVLGRGPEGCAVTVADGDSDRLALSTGDNFYVNVEAFQIRFELGPESGGGGPFDEHLVVFRDLNFLNTDFPGTSRIISGVTFDTDLVGMDASRISFSDHGVVVNHANISYPGGQYLILTLETRVPEPSTLMLTTIAALALPLRRRKLQHR